MAVSHGKSAALLADERNLTNYGKYVTLEPVLDVHDTTVFGASYRSRITGLKHATIAGDLVWDADVGASHEALVDAYGQTTPVIHSFFPQGYAAGSLACLLYTTQNRLTVQQAVDDIVKISFGANATEDGADMGVSLRALAAETSSTNAASVDNTASTANGGVGVLHITAVSGSTPSMTVKIQHSNNNSTWADLVTFTAATAVGAQRSEVAAGTTVNRYLRAISTISGSSPSFTYQVSFARR